MIKTFITSVLIISTFVACSPKQPCKNTYTQKPKWISNPYQDSKIGAVGVANRHAKGFAFQRKIAIARALDELAMQKDVHVSIKLNKNDTLINDTSKVYMNADSNYVAEDIKITAHIEDVWKDNYTQEFYVWLVLD